MADSFEGIPREFFVRKSRRLAIWCMLGIWQVVPNAQDILVHGNWANNSQTKCYSGSTFWAVFHSTQYIHVRLLWFARLEANLAQTKAVNPWKPLDIGTFGGNGGNVATSGTRAQAENRVCVSGKFPD